MRKILALLLLFSIVFCMANTDSVLAAKKGKKAAGGITEEQMTTIVSSLDTLNKKIYSNSLFSPQETAQLGQIKMQLDDQMLIASDPSYAPLYYKLGNLFKAREFKDAAIDCYQTVLENFADTALAPKAVKELKAMGVEIKDPSAGGDAATGGDAASGG